MEQPSTLGDQIIQAVSDSPGCLLEELVQACPGLTWNQIFFHVDRLSRTGQVQLTMTGAGQYVVRLSRQAAHVVGPGAAAGAKSVDTRTLQDGQD